MNSLYIKGLPGISKSFLGMLKEPAAVPSPGVNSMAITNTHSPALQTSPCVRRAIINYRKNGIATSGEKATQIAKHPQPWKQTLRIRGTITAPVSRQFFTRSNPMLTDVQTPFLGTPLVPLKTVGSKHVCAKFSKTYVEVWTLKPSL